MRGKSLRSAEALFDAIGNIDDRLIQEALHAPVASARRSRYGLKAIIVLAAVLTLTVGILATAVVAKLISSVKNALDDPYHDGYDSIDTAPTTQSLSQTLISAQSDATVVSDASDIDFFDGSMRIVWRIEGENEYRMVTLTSQSDATRLVRAIEAQKQAIFPENTESIQCEVWITLGDGRVISPYLKTSAGNVGYAELFEYSPEIEPDENLTSLINDLISD